MSASPFLLLGNIMEAMPAWQRRVVGLSVIAIAALMVTVLYLEEVSAAQEAERRAAALERALERGGCRLVAVEHWTPAKWLCADGVTYQGRDAVMANFGAP